MEFAVYILYSRSSFRNYTGFTNHLIERIRSHNVYGKDSTRFYRPWEVVYLEFFADKRQAMRREKYFKSGRGVALKKKIIEEYLARWAHTLP